MTGTGEICASVDLAQYMDAPFLSNSEETCYPTAAPSVRPPTSLFIWSAAELLVHQNGTGKDVVVFHDASFSKQNISRFYCNQIT